jgi:D-3-phosphoglycerate dehydrogenase
MSGYTVVVTDHDFADLSIEREILGDVADVVEFDRGDGDIEETLAMTDAVINLRLELGAERIAHMDDVRVIARYGIGVDNVDIEAAAERDVPVTNVPDYCQEEVALHALTFMLALSRRVKTYDDSVGSGEWDRSVAAPIHRFSTRTVGVVGYGSIGRAVGERVDALGATVVASDPFLSTGDVADDPATLLAFEALIERADVVTIHSPLTDETRGSFDRETFARMRDRAYLVNVARGPIVDADALLAALDAGELAGAGLDVFPTEPPPTDHPLRSHPKTIVTPHVSWYSEEANEQRRRTVAHIVENALTGGQLENVVNGVE